MLSNAKKEDIEGLGIVGVACTLNLISCGWKSSNFSILPQCVLLEHVACKSHWLKADIYLNGARILRLL